MLYIFISSVIWTNWKSGEPNNYEDKEDCVGIDARGRWNDMKCESIYPFICEKDSPITSEIPDSKNGIILCTLLIIGLIQAFALSTYFFLEFQCFENFRNHFGIKSNILDYVHSESTLLDLESPKNQKIIADDNEGIGFIYILIKWSFYLVNL